MATSVLDVRDLPEDRVQYLKDLIALWKKEGTQDQGTHTLPPIVKRKVHPDEFIVRKSRVIGGAMTRAMAYDED